MKRKLWARGMVPVVLCLMFAALPQPAARAVTDTTPPTGTIVINGDRSATNSRTVTIAMTWSDGAGSGVARMRFSDDGSTWSAYESLTPSRSYTLPVGADGHRTVRVQFIDKANNRSATYSDYILLDRTLPTGSITINGGAATTPSLPVTLGLTWNDGAGAGVTRMRFSDNGSTWTSWEIPTTPRAYTLPTGLGYHTVRVQYLDGAGNYSPVYNDYIKVVAPPQATVPNVVNETQAAASYDITNANLILGTVTQQCSDSVTAGNVITQTPVAGSTVNPGGAVDLVVSTGTCRVTVPSVVGKTQTAATASITGAGLVVGTTAQYCSNTVAAGSVLRQTPVGNALVTAGGAIDLVISSGACPEMPCGAYTLLDDGDFESGGKGWAETSSAGSTVITDKAGSGKAPHTGSWWAWFGNSANADQATLTQKKIIPSASAFSATLNFYVRILSAGTGSGTMTVSIDGDTVAKFSGKDASLYSTYTQVSLDVSNYTDDATHTIVIAAGTSGANAFNYTYFMVDDLCLYTNAASYYDYPLTVSRTGAGNGTVTGPSINCGGDCSSSISTHGYVFNLTATPDANSTFTGWTGADTASDNTCTVAMTRARTVTAAFAPKDRTLNLVVVGTGGTGGSILGYNISCNSSCQYSYLNGTTVNLSVLPLSGSKFTGWNGADTTSGSTCTVTLGADRTVTANFAPDTRTLTVTKGGTGGGTITSSVGGINCGDTCSAGILVGTTVTLTAAPDTNSTFTGWTGADSSSANTCTAAMAQDKSVQANFTLKTYTLSISKTGSGTVTSNTGGINCGSTCSATFNAGTSVQLTAAPTTPGYIFTGWSGDAAGTANPVTVAMSGAKSVTANFAAQNYTLNITKSGNGAGIVTSGSAGISCGTDCTESYPAGTVVTLTAVATTGSFSAWTGADSPSGASCTVTMNGNKTVDAAFVLPNYTLTVSKGGNGNGFVTANGINCPGDCTENYASGTVVPLTATASSDSTFTGWSGDASGSTSPYSLTMNAAKNVTATFTLKTYTLSTGKTGSGTVTSNTGGINCGSTCSATFNAGTAVQLSATPAAGYAFANWSGDATGTANPVTVNMNGAKSVTANFTQSYTLTISKTGNGTVTSNTGGINCGTTCSASYAPGTVVTLTAAADTGYTFDHWTGADSSSGTSCSVTMNAVRGVSATFISASGVTIRNDSDFWIVSAKLNGVELLPTINDSIQCDTTGTKTYAVTPGSVSYHFGLGGWSQDGTTRIEQITFEGNTTIPSGSVILPVGSSYKFLTYLSNGQSWWSYWSTEHCGQLRPLRLIFNNTGAWQLYVWLGSAWSLLSSGTATFTPCLFDPIVFKFNDTHGILKDDPTNFYPQINAGGLTLHALAICDPGSVWDYYEDSTQKPADSNHPPYQ